MIADYLGTSSESRFGQSFHWGGTKAIDMRYGENPHQQAALYGDFLRVAEPLHGKELSYNNVVDIDAAMALGLEFLDAPSSAVAIFKHNTPCGVGTGGDPVEAWDRAFATDPESPFGGIVISTRPWTLALAQKVDELFTEVLIAPDFAPDALALLKKKKNRRLVRWHPDRMTRNAATLRGVAGGLLVQDADRPGDEFAKATVATKRQPTVTERTALEFAWKVRRRASKRSGTPWRGRRGRRSRWRAPRSRATRSSRSPTASKKRLLPAPRRSCSPAARRAMPR
jgi:phosphoribosylaminoimidazolecarboxamide formyltransferase/IMP cyclohydrolase